MAVDKRRESAVIPQYSLTGDLLSFLRCGLQYRYLNGSSLPPSRPVQLWFGEFIHGILETGYRLWRDSAPPLPFPWPMTITAYRAPQPGGRVDHDIGAMGDIVEASLRAQGKNPRSAVVRDSAYARAERAINELAPDLFPLIAAAEESVIGTRDMPGGGAASRATLYELHGTIDVVTEVEFDGAPDTNIFKQAIQEARPGLTGNFEVIVDYKGSRRPATSHGYWQQGAWQLQTYAWLRARQPGSRPVAAGVLIYINELAPTAADLVVLKREIARGETDVIPPAGSRDAYELNAWSPGAAVPNFSFAFRFERAVRIVPIDAASQTTATIEFDAVVQQIEQCVEAEAVHGVIMNHWSPCGDEDTCAACDFRHFCPDPAPRSGLHTILAPSAP